MTDGLNAVRGILWGLLISIPIDAAIIVALWFIGGKMFVSQ